MAAFESDLQEPEIYCDGPTLEEIAGHDRSVVRGYTFNPTLFPDPVAPARQGPGQARGKGLHPAHRRRIGSGANQQLHGPSAAGAAPSRSRFFSATTSR